MALTAYQLPPEARDRIKALADPLCYKCKGEGTTEWRNQGLAAVVCDCTKAKLAAQEELLEKAVAKLEGLIAQAKAKVAAGVERPQRSCMECQKVEDAANEKLVVVNENCDVCKNTRAIPLTDEEWGRYVMMQEAK
jgi:hypothetical protein